MNEVENADILSQPLERLAPLFSKQLAYLDSISLTQGLENH
jgi:hypothetical protein